jgi:hypothetical protein
VSDLLPPDLGLQPLHTRKYEVQAFKVDDATMLLRGAVRDTKPPDLYIIGDPEPLAIHHMVVDLTVSYPLLEITAVDVVFETHPHGACPTITEHYGNLVGLSIARGFTHRVRELFGGPRGCTHTTALLQAMAPVAVQCTWSMRVAKARELGNGPRAPLTPEQREMMIAANLGTCHVWDPEGELATSVRAGDMPEPPLPVVVRLRELGRDISDWRP